MEIFITYLLKVNVGIAIFYLLYLLIFNKDTFFTMRRIYLIGAILFSLIYPLFPIYELGAWLNFGKPAGEIQTAVSFGELSAGAVMIDDIPAAAPLINWMLLLKILLAAITLFFVVRVLWHLIMVIKIKKNSEQHTFCNIPYQHLNQQSAPFSFFKWIFVYPEAHSEEKLKQILFHEMVHVKQWHSADIMLMELLAPLLWYNPLFWFLRKEIAINNEFIADRQVLQKGIDRRDYQYHLLHLTYPVKNIQSVNYFNISQLKQRIMMMNKEKTPVKKLMKYTLIFPIALLLIAANSVYAQKKDPVQTTSEPKLILESNNDTIVKPLIVIDGVKMEKGYDMEQISPNDIESISVLKNHSATSLYGDEGRDGVIIIATKKMNLSKTSADKHSTSSNGDEVFITVEQMPAFPGGERAMMRFLADNLKYPVIAQENGIQGRVISEFIVKKDGAIEDIGVIRGVDPSLDAEAVRIIGLMPKWVPAVNKGEKVAVRFTLPIVFRLQGGESGHSPVKEEKLTVGTQGNVIDEIVVVGYGGSKSNNTVEEVFVVVEQQPEFPGGNEALLQYLADNTEYPAIAKEHGIQGRVIVSFVVEKDGSIVEAAIERGVDPSIDKEALRVIEAMPHWKPGKQRGQEVRVRFTLPVDFKLPDNKETE